MWLPVALILVPIIEIALLIKVGGLIGFWATLALLLAMAALGSWLLRWQGMAALDDLRRAVTEMRDPTLPVAHGALILFAGLLMVTPGFFTDLIGLCLLIRPVRDRAIRHMSHRWRIVGMGQTASSPPFGRGDGDVIDADFTPLDENPRSRPPSGWTRD